MQNRECVIEGRKKIERKAEEEEKSEERGFETITTLFVI